MRTPARLLLAAAIAVVPASLSAQLRGGTEPYVLDGIVGKDQNVAREAGWFPVSIGFVGDDKAPERWIGLTSFVTWNGDPFVGRELSDLEQAVDEKAQAALCGHATGARMGRVEKAQRFEVRHHVAYRSGRQGDRKPLAQRARANRLARREKRLDEVAKYFAGPFTQSARRGPGGRRFHYVSL